MGSLKKLPPQIVRLVILTMAIVGSYVVARQIFTPKSFGQFGHYRGAALTELASRDPKYGGAKSCVECHDEVFKKTAKYPHNKISCETCHGPSKVHGDDPDHHDAVKLTSEVCARCHDINPAKPTFLKQVDLKKHYSDKGKCTECHLPHQPTEMP
jgi:hypothetical protein